jgi:hypothetical protein
MLKISFFGDVVPDGVLSYFRQEPAVSKSIYRNLKESDIVVATLESPFGYAKTISGDKKNIIYSPVEDFFRLEELNISAVSLANNHVLDLSEEGFETTLKLLESNKIRHCGAGRNLSEARTPAFIEKMVLRWDSWHIVSRITGFWERFMLLMKKRWHGNPFYQKRGRRHHRRTSSQDSTLQVF